MTPRERELADGLRQTRQRIEDACLSAGRDPGEIVLVVVTKYFPASDIAILSKLGVRDIAENRYQEVREKLDTVQAHGLRMHFVGQIQSNKAAAIAHAVDVVQSVDRPKLVPRLAHAASGRSAPLPVLLQISLDEDHARGGVPPEQAIDLARAVSSYPALTVKGVMAVAPLGVPAAPAFERLGAISAQLVHSYPEATWISAGMSQDLEAAIGAGATHLRVGSAILGSRPSPQ